MAISLAMETSCLKVDRLTARLLEGERMAAATEVIGTRNASESENSRLAQAVMYAVAQ